MMPYLHRLSLQFVWIPLSYKTRNYFIRAYLGMAAVFICIGITNWNLRGSPFVTGFQRMPYFETGSSHIIEQPYIFSFKILFSDWYSKLFSLEYGLLIYNPCLILFPLYVTWLLKPAQTKWLKILIIIALTNFGVVYSLNIWSMHNNANRYLLPAIILLILPVGAWTKSGLLFLRESLTDKA